MANTVKAGYGHTFYLEVKRAKLCSCNSKHNPQWKEAAAAVATAKAAAEATTVAAVAVVLQSLSLPEPLESGLEERFLKSHNTMHPWSHKDHE
mmetsp:Transcript_120414/g.239648  ORF Transcript_120414/g.239648 Transcript_120414/m.239648 type:complete len:93 (-) Transcript_120414:131-409(-)